jgi:hypothetical protein
LTSRNSRAKTTIVRATYSTSDTATPQWEVQAQSPLFSSGIAIEPRMNAQKADPNATYATPGRFLTEPMRPEVIWAVLSDLDRWPRWDTSMERVALQGPEITADFPEAMDGLLACAVA